MRLKNIREIKGKIILQSGLHIAAGNTEMRIGGTDNPVVKHPHSNEPFIPGSSIKGKVRSLLELRSGLMRFTGGKPVNSQAWKGAEGREKEEAKKILQLFGTSGADGEAAMEIGPTRSSFADCALNKECRERILGNSMPLTEVKSENSINRIRGVADNPRFFERVPAGVEFDFSITIKEMEGDGDLVSFLLDGLRLLELDALGGSGSRGYGRVKFVFDDAALQQKFDAANVI